MEQHKNSKGAAILLLGTLLLESCGLADDPSDAYKHYYISEWGCLADTPWDPTGDYMDADIETPSDQRELRVVPHDDEHQTLVFAVTEGDGDGVHSWKLTPANNETAEILLEQGCDWLVDPHADAAPQ